jgi:translation initiation factor 2B subunit (eIF-2B alpha/beta/delta family)
VFDITPSRYINDGCIITEIGALKQSEVADVMATKTRYLTVL